MTQHQWDSALDPQVVPLFLSLQWAQARSLHTMRPLLLAHELTMAEFDVLATLRNAPAPHEMTPSGIQDQVLITSGGLTKVMLQLEARALVERFQRDGDLRVKPLRLTDAGKQLIEQAMDEAVARTGAWINGALAPAEIAALTALLGKLAES